MKGTVIVEESLYAFNFVLSGFTPTPSHVKVVWTLVSSCYGQAAMERLLEALVPQERLQASIFL